MLKKFSNLSLWLAMLFVLAAVQAHTAFGQASEVVGSWRNGSSSIIQYKNSTTGTIKPGSGSLANYKFNANGTYEYIGYLEMTMYNCTTQAFANLVGRYTVSGSTISFNPTKDFWKNTNSCAASSNKEQTRVPTKLSVSFDRRQDEYGKELLCITAKEGEACYRKEE
jgi:hypothetical protein